MGDLDVLDMNKTKEMTEVKSVTEDVKNVTDEVKVAKEADWFDLLTDLEADLDTMAKTQAELLWRQAYKQQCEESQKLQNQLEQLREEQKIVCPEPFTLTKSGPMMEACLLKIMQDRLELKQRLLMKKRWLKMNKDEEVLKVLRKEQTMNDPTKPLDLEHKTFTVKVIKVLLDVVQAVNGKENKKAVVTGIFEVLLLYPQLVKHNPGFSEVMRAKCIEFIRDENLACAKQAYAIFFDVNAEDYKAALQKWD